MKNSVNPYYNSSTSRFLCAFFVTANRNLFIINVL